MGVVYAIMVMPDRPSARKFSYGRGESSWIALSARKGFGGLVLLFCVLDCVGMVKEIRAVLFFVNWEFFGHCTVNRFIFWCGGESCTGCSGMNYSSEKH